MIPVPFPHEPDAQRKSVEMRAKAMAHLKEGGVISVFPAGVVASSDTMFGPVIEREWAVFTAQMIRRSGRTRRADLLPRRQFPRLPDRQPISATLRQGFCCTRWCAAATIPSAPSWARPSDAERMEDAAQRSARLHGVAARAYAVSRQ
jgi:hypothetical protein